MVLLIGTACKTEHESTSDTKGLLEKLEYMSSDEYSEVIHLSAVLEISMYKNDVPHTTRSKQKEFFDILDHAEKYILSANDAQKRAEDNGWKLNVENLDRCMEVEKHYTQSLEAFKSLVSK